MKRITIRKSNLSTSKQIKATVAILCATSLPSRKVSVHVSRVEPWAKVVKIHRKQGASRQSVINLLATAGVKLTQTDLFKWEAFNGMSY